MENNTSSLLVAGKPRNFGLDVLRACSIICVVVSHAVTLPVELGILGVQIFFVLSGFLIGQILIKDLRIDASRKMVLKFWKRRWFRTLPLYYLILIFKILFYGNPFGWKIIVYFLFLQANILGINFFGVSWSLVVEEWFYIFLPLSSFVFFRKGFNPKNYLAYLISFILFFLICRFLWNFYEKGIIIYQFDCLLLGVVLALIKMNNGFIYSKLNSGWIFLIGLIGTGICIIWFGTLNNIALYDYFFRVFWYFIISICITLLIPFIESSVFFNYKLKRFKALNHFFTWTSILTYSIYLTHMEIFGAFKGLPRSLELVSEVTLIYLVSFIIYFFYEHPMMNLREEFSFKNYLNTIKSFKF